MRFLSIAAISVSAMLAADSAPNPPCGGEAIPPYPALEKPPAVQIWGLATWAPPSCTGWKPSPSSTLVVTTGRFRHTAGAADLRRRIGAISALQGLLYWSTSNQKWQPLILEAYAVADPATDTLRPDFQPDEVAAGHTLYAQQTDNLFGKALYRIHIASVSGTHLVFSSENAETMRYLGVPLFSPSEIQTVTFLDRESKDVWRYYSIARTGKAASLLLGGHQASIVNRAVASYRYLAGIPADREPPSAR